MVRGITKRKPFMSRVWGLIWPLMLTGFVSLLIEIIYLFFCGKELFSLAENIDLKNEVQTLLFKTEPLKMVFQYMATIIIFLLLYELHDSDEIKARIKEQKFSIWYVPLVFIFAIVTTFAFMLSTKNIPQIFTFAKNPVLILIENNYSVYAAILFLGILTPIMKEITFRLIIYRRAKAFFSFMPAVFISSIFFALTYQGLSQFINAFLLGVVFSLMYEHFGSIIVPIFMHIINNVILIVITYNENISKIISEHTFLTHFVAIVLFTIYCYLIFGKMKRVNRC